MSLIFSTKCFFFTLENLGGNITPEDKRKLIKIIQNRILSDKNITNHKKFQMEILPQLIQKTEK